LLACGNAFKLKTEPKEPREEDAIHTEHNALLKKYAQSRSREKEMIMMRGVTPFQTRKLA
jgi:hypothetical protein